MNLPKKHLGLLLLLILSLQASLSAANYKLEEITPEAKQILIAQNDRAEILTQLKKTQMIGENASGYLTVLKNPETSKWIVHEENKDRKKLYRIIAEQNRLGGSGMGAIENDAAESIRREAAKGDSIQLPTGKWVQKS